VADLFPNFRKFVPGAAIFAPTPDPAGKVADDTRLITTPGSLIPRPTVDPSVLSIETLPAADPGQPDAPPASWPSFIKPKPSTAVAAAIAAARGKKNHTLAVHPDGLPIPTWYDPDGPPSDEPTFEVSREWVQTFRPICGECLGSIYQERTFTDGKVLKNCVCCGAETDGESKLDLAEARKAARIAAKNKLVGKPSSSDEIISSDLRELPRKPI
jgi:hypothetical protein